MKIAYFTNQYPKVSHTFIRREIAALEARGVQIERFSIRHTPDSLIDPLDVAEQKRTHVLLDRSLLSLLWGVVVVFVQRPLRFMQAFARAWDMGMRSDRSFYKHLGDMITACALIRATSDLGCEHVHVHFGTNPAAVALLSRMMDGPTYSFTVHGPEEFDKPWSIALRQKISASEFVAGVSSFGRSQLYRQARLQDWPKVKVVRCGVDQSYTDNEPVSVPDSRTLVCVGRLCEQKGQMLLLNAAAALKREGVSFKLVLVGDGEMRSDLEYLIANEGLSESVEITGWASGEEVRHRLLEARAMVLPSFAEGLPVVIMEALALGRPVITTYIAGIPELVLDGECGWLVPAGSVEALTDAMRDCLNSDLPRLSFMGKVDAQISNARATRSQRIER